MELKNYKKMVELQHRFNILDMGENYLDLNLNWNSAIIAESGEMLDSLGYKWWKKQTVDLDNAKVEAIDLLHFVISEDLEDSKKDIIVNGANNFFIGYTVEELFNHFETNPFGYRFNTSTSTEFIISMIDELMAKGYHRFTILKQIFTALEMSNEDVYIAYIVKNCLNKFRQDNGYKDGTYQKIWVDKEDNVFAYELAKNIGADENLFDLLYADLEATYSYYFKSGVENRIIN